jgi:LPXTG-motif cell wall-anchored protein
MKKLVSLLIAVIMVVSLFALAVPATAAGTDPSFAASESKVIAFKALKNGQPGNGINPGAMYDKDYAGDNLNPLNDGADYGTNTKKAEKLKAYTNSQAGTFYTMFSENTGDLRYSNIFQVSLGSGTDPELTKISTIVLAVPGAASVVAANGLPTNLAVYYGNEEWQAVTATSTNYADAVAANKANYKELCTMADLTGTDTEPSKFVESADGSFRYIEYTLDTPIEAKYLVVGLKSQNWVYYTEFAAFSPAETATEPETTAASGAGGQGQSGTTNPTTGDNTVIVLAVVAVVAIAGAAVVVRRKEHN